jgi:hypothetical protein
MLYVFFWVIPGHTKFTRRGITQKKTYNTHLRYLASSAAFEGGTVLLGRRIITDSRFEVSDFLELVEEEL